MNDKFGRDNRYASDRYVSDQYRDDSYRERYRGDYGSGDYGWSRDRDRSRFDGSYAPSYAGFTPEARGGHSGRGPKGYVRADERIREDVCERLSWNDEVDATDISVRVENGEVSLEGSVETRHMKRLAEDIADSVSGVRDVHNTLRVQKPMLTEIKEKLTGEAGHEHYANTGTKTTSPTQPASAPNGLP